MTRVTDYIANFISEIWVNDVFLLTWWGMMFLSDWIIQNKKLNYFCNHHEQAVAMAAVGYAKYTNNLWVAYITTGCWWTNAVTWVLNAWQDSIPVLFISGQVKTINTTRKSGLKLRQFGVQELDIIPIVESITKYAIMIDDPHQIAYHLEKAVYLAKNGRPGPVWIDVPLDIQWAEIDENKLIHFNPSELSINYQQLPSEEELEDITKMLKQAKRPIIIAWQWIRLSDTKKQFRDFIESYNIPVVVPYLGVGLLPTDHHLFVGIMGAKGDRAWNFALQNADLLLVLWSRLDVSAIWFEGKKFAREAKKIVVDIDKIEHSKKLVDIDKFVHADLRWFFEKIKQTNVWKLDTESRIEKCNEWKNKWPVVLDEYAKITEWINLYSFVDILSRKMKDGSVVVSDAWSAFYVTTQAIHLKEHDRYITSGWQAEMWFTVPCSIWVSIAHNRWEVLGITWDWSFQLNIQELQTIVHYNLPIKTFVWNNDGYLSIRATQSKFFNKRFIWTDSASWVSFPSVEKIANAYWIKYFKIENAQDMLSKIDNILWYKGPILCEVICIRDQEIIPAVSSLKKDDWTMVSKPMEDMYPFLDRKEFLDNMIIKPLEE